MNQEELNALVKRLKGGDNSAAREIAEALLDGRLKNLDTAKLRATAKVKLEKFDGEKVDGDGKVPVEVIETIEELL